MMQLLQLRILLAVLLVSLMPVMVMLLLWTWVRTLLSPQSQKVTRQLLLVSWVREE